MCLSIKMFRMRFECLKVFRMSSELFKSVLTCSNVGPPHPEPPYPEPPYQPLGFSYRLIKPCGPQHESRMRKVKFVEQQKMNSQSGSALNCNTAKNEPSHSRVSLYIH